MPFAQQKIEEKTITIRELRIGGIGRIADNGHSSLEGELIYKIADGEVIMLTGNAHYGRDSSIHSYRITELPIGTELTLVIN